MLRIARDLDMLTIGYAFNEEDTERLMQEAAPDIFIFHAGITAGGATGDAGGSSLDDTAARSESHFAIARRIKPDVILLAHGAAIVEPEDAQYMLDHTSCHGVQLGSSIERMAIERPLEAARRGVQDRRVATPPAARDGRNGARPVLRADGRRRATAATPSAISRAGTWNRCSPSPTRREAVALAGDPRLQRHLPAASGPSRVRSASAPYAAMAAAVADRLAVPACLLFNECRRSGLGARGDRRRLRPCRCSATTRSRRPSSVDAIMRRLPPRRTQRGAAVEAELEPLAGVGGDLHASDAAGAARLTDPGCGARLRRAHRRRCARRQCRPDASATGDARCGSTSTGSRRLRAPVRSRSSCMAARRSTRTTLREAIELGVRKINVGSRLKQTYFNALREACADVAATANPYEVIGSGLARRRARPRPAVAAARGRALDASLRQRRKGRVMKYPIVIPHLGATGGDVKIIEWLVAEGAPVKAGQALLRRGDRQGDERSGGVPRRVFGASDQATAGSECAPGEPRGRAERRTALKR